MPGRHAAPEPEAPTKKELKRIGGWLALMPTTPRFSATWTRPGNLTGRQRERKRPIHTDTECLRSNGCPAIAWRYSAELPTARNRCLAAGWWFLPRPCVLTTVRRQPSAKPSALVCVL